MLFIAGVEFPPRGYFQTKASREGDMVRKRGGSVRGIDGGIRRKAISVFFVIGISDFVEQFMPFGKRPCRAEGELAFQRFLKIQLYKIAFKNLHVIIALNYGIECIHERKNRFVAVELLNISSAGQTYAAGSGLVFDL